MADVVALPMDFFAVGRAKALAAVDLSRERSALEQDDYGKWCIAYAESPAEQTRRAKARRRRHMATDDWEKDLIKSLAGLVSDQMLKILCGKTKDQASVCLNPFRDITQELGVLYLAPPTFTDPKPEGDRNQAELYSAALEGTNFGSFWQSAELDLERHNVVGLRPVVRDHGPLGKVLKHTVLLPDVFSVVFDEDDPTHVEAVTLIDKFTYANGRPGCRYIVIRDDWHMVFDDQLERVDMNTNPDGINPWGIIPIEFWRLNQSSDDFWDTTTGDDLVNLTLRVGRMLTSDDHLLRMSSHKQLVAVGDQIRGETRFLADPSAFIKLEGSGVSAQIVDWSPPIEARMKYLFRLIEAAARSRGVVNEGPYDSGLKLRLSERGLWERRKRKVEPACEVQQGYRQRLLRVARAAGIDAGDTDKRIKIDHAPIQYPTDPIKQLEVHAKRVELDVDSPLSLILRENPGMTKAEARKILSANIREKVRVAQIKQQFNVPKRPDNVTRDAEEAGRLGGRPTTSNESEGPGPDSGKPADGAGTSESSLRGENQ